MIQKRVRIPQSGTVSTPVPEFKDLVFAKTSPKRSFSMSENERFGLVFSKKTGSINSGIVHIFFAQSLNAYDATNLYEEFRIANIFEISRIAYLSQKG
jgi:hypothetical protein